MNFNARLVAFIEQSFLNPLLSDPNITDVSYNGEIIFFQHNVYGRKKSDIPLNSDQAMDFIKQVANLSEQLFSFSNPILDVSAGKYRINAVGPAISRKKYAKSTTFSIRIGKEMDSTLAQSLVNDSDVEKLFFALVKNGISMVIAGTTGSGKTELQKYLISLMAPNVRVIVIDNVLELEAASGSLELDLNVWQVNSSLKKGTCSALVENALRSHPDWLVVAEARGEEMKDVLMAAMTGHPVITTLHSLDVSTISSRMVRMVMSGNPTLRYDETLMDIQDHFPIVIYMKKEQKEDLSIRRYIQKIAEITPNQYKPRIIYSLDSKFQKKISRLSSRLLSRLVEHQTGPCAFWPVSKKVGET